MTAIQKAREALVKSREAMSDSEDFGVFIAVIAKIDAALAALDAGMPATPADVGELVERLRERWEATDAPVAKKINRYLKLCREAATALERVVKERDEARAKLEEYEGCIQRVIKERAEKAEAELTTLRARLETVEAETPDYDAGLLNDYGGGDVGWWQDYLRAEIGRANDYWREAIRNLEPRHD